MCIYEHGGRGGHTNDYDAFALQHAAIKLVVNILSSTLILPVSKIHCSLFLHPPPPTPHPGQPGLNDIPFITCIFVHPTGCFARSNRWTVYQPYHHSGGNLSRNNKGEKCQSEKGCCCLIVVICLNRISLL